MQVQNEEHRIPTIEDHRIPANSDINERLLTGRFGANETSLGASMYEQVFIFRSNW